MKRVLAVVSMTVIFIFTFGSFVHWGLSCACEGPNHFAAINPFRDRAPERKARVFFQELAAGRCKPENKAVCQQALRNGPVSSWELATRETREGIVILYYDVIYQNSAVRSTSVSFRLQAEPTGWKIVDYRSSD